MHQLNSIVELCSQGRRLLTLALALTVWLVPIPIHGQHAEGDQLSREVLPPRLGAAWRALGESRSLDAEKVTVLQDADLYLEYGLQRLITQAYTSGREKVTVEMFEMKYPAGAYGLYTFNRGSLSPDRQEFHVGRYLVSLTAGSEGGTIDPGLIEALRQQLASGEVELPPLPDNLPAQDKVAATEKYVVGPAGLSRIPAFSDLKEVIGFTGGAEAALAAYEHAGGQMSLAIIEYHTPQLASDAYARLKGHVESLSQEEKGQRLLKRVGNYIVEAVGVRDVEAAQALIGKIKYTPRVYWEGRKVTAIPLPFRAPDPVALEEAAQTAHILVTTFLAIGVLLIGAIGVGIVTGGAVFYWRRYRRRKLGIDEFFSDAGGTVRLNLDDYLLSASDPQQPKLVGKGD